MFTLKPSAVKSELEVVRTKAIAGLENLAPDSDEYKKIIAHVETLSELIEAARPKRLDINTVAVILGNVGIAGMILWHERDNVLSTKVLPFMSKAKS